MNLVFKGFGILIFLQVFANPSAFAFSFEMSGVRSNASDANLDLFTRLNENLDQIHSVTSTENLSQYDSILGALKFDFIRIPISGGTVKTGVYGKYLYPNRLIQEGTSDSTLNLLQKETELSGIMGGGLLELYTKLGAFDLGATGAIGIGPYTINQKVYNSNNAGQLDIGTASRSEIELSSIAVEVSLGAFFRFHISKGIGVNLKGGYTRFKTTSFEASSVYGQKYENVTKGDRIYIIDNESGESIEMQLDLSGVTYSAGLEIQL